jgi:hypothetical protein
MEKQNMNKFTGEQKTVLAIGMVLALSAGTYYFLNLDNAGNAHHGASIRPAKSIPPESRTSLPPSEEGVAQAPADEGEQAGIAANGGNLGENLEENDDALLLGQMPDPQTVHRQGGENPHMTPRVLLEFAHQLAGLMERAMDSEQEAGPVFAQLEDCAGDPQSKEVIQARLICLANASRLSKQYPDLLGKRYGLLAAKVPNLVGMLQVSGLE